MERENRTEPEKVYIEKADSSAMGWAVAFIVLVMAIGFGYIAYSNQQTVNQYKVEEALGDLKDGNMVAEATKPERVEIEIPEIKMPKVKMPDVDLPDINVKTNEEPKANSGETAPGTTNSTTPSTPENSQ